MPSEQAPGVNGAGRDADAQQARTAASGLLLSMDDFTGFKAIGKGK